jgi:hypothetical protein
MTYRPSRLLVAAAVAVTLGVGFTAAVASGGDFKAKKDAFFADVAQRLGVTTEALDEAVKGARIDQVEQALQDGKLTQEEADAAKEAIESGEARGFGPGFGPRGGGFGHHGHGHRGALGLDAAAAYLGLSQDELRTELDSGKSLSIVAGEKGKSIDGLKQAMLEDATAKLDEAVAAGRITSEQKSAMLERLSAMVDRVIERVPGEKRDAKAPASFQGSIA